MADDGPPQDQFPPQYFDPEFCQRMADYHRIIAERYHEDGWYDEFRFHMAHVRWWEARKKGILEGKIHR